MKDTIVPSETFSGAYRGSRGLLRILQKWSRNLIFRRLAALQRGHLTVTDAEGTFSFGEDDFPGTPAASIFVSDPSFYADVAFGGTIGAGEAYMAGSWRTDDLTAVVRIVLQNRDLLMNMEGGTAAAGSLVHFLMHALRKNTPDGSRRNITAHYDLGNDFYSLFLDDSMTYSCAVFERPDMTLQEAQIAKYDRLCRKLELSPGHHLLEIGTGWGSFAIYAARHYGCRVTTTTISREQAAWAREHVEAEGLQSQITVLQEDYRDLKGAYDRLVSIEMIEAVGHHFLESFLQSCGRLLKKDGQMGLQAITIADQHYRQHIRSADFIKRYIFPGSCIPSLTAVLQAATRASDLRLFHMEDQTPHYARTLREWRQRFNEQIDAVRMLGYPETFARMWEFYLCYCEAGFQERYLGNVQMVFAKPWTRRNPILPALA